MRKKYKKYPICFFATLFAAAMFSCLQSFSAGAQGWLSPGEAQPIPYSQSFSGFVDVESLPAGWALDDEYGYMGQFGSGTAGGLRGDGVLGFQLTASGVNGSITTSLSLSNNSGAAINGLVISYTGRVARVDQEGTPHWVVSVNGTPYPELEYSTADGIDKHVSHVISDLVIEAGEDVLIEWHTTSSGTTGTRRQIGITDVSVQASGDLPPPPPPGPGSYTIPHLDEDVDLLVKFEPIDYQLLLSVSPEGGGWIQSLPDAPYYHVGDEVLLQASPEAGYRFVAWEGDVQYLSTSQEEETLLTMPAQHVSLTAVFSLATFTIHFDVEGENGSIDATANGEPIESGDQVEEGSQVIFNASPDEGYRVKHWIINGEVVQPEDEEALMIDSLDGDAQVKVLFEDPAPGVPLHLVLASAGDVLIGPSDGHLCFDAKVSIQVPGEGFFSRW